MKTKINQVNRAGRGISRRALLGGGAALVGLPFFDSLESARAQDAQVPPVRLLYYFVPNGMDMDSFRPTATGPGYDMPAILTPLAPLQDDVMIVTGLNNQPALPDDLGHHAAGTAAFLTCAHANKSLTDIRNGISVDQVAAQAFGGETRIPSLQLGLEGGSRAGDCDSGYACDYARNISWANDTTPLPKIVDPQIVFDQIFAGYDPDATDAEIERRRQRKASVLDLVVGDATRLQNKLGYDDRLKLEQYLTGVRGLEKRVANSSAFTCVPGDRPASDRDLEYPEYIRVMADLMVTAFQCDSTRIISFMQGNALSGRTYPFLGITRGHHDISHHGGNQENIDMLIQIGTWEMEQLAYLLERMRSIPEGPDESSNMLENSVVYCCSDISDGDFHNADDKPVIVAGRGGGFLSSGRHIAYPRGFNVQKEKMSNLLVTTLAAAGVESGLGDSDKPLLEEMVL